MFPTTPRMVNNTTSPAKTNQPPSITVAQTTPRHQHAIREPLPCRPAHGSHQPYRQPLGGRYHHRLPLPRHHPRRLPLLPDPEKEVSGATPSTPRKTPAGRHHKFQPSRSPSPNGAAHPSLGQRPRDEHQRTSRAVSPPITGTTNPQSQLQKPTAASNIRTSEHGTGRHQPFHGRACTH